MKGNDKKEYKNWYKALLRIQRYCKLIIQSFRRAQKSDWILLGALILMIPIWLGISEKLYSWLNIKNITDFLNGKELFNLSICFIISCFAIWWWRKIWKDKDIRPFRLGIILFLFSILVFDNNITYANIVGIINYKIFFLFLLKVSFYIMAFKFFLIPVIISNFWKFIVEIAKKVKDDFKEFIENRNFYKVIKEVINTLIYKPNNKPELKGFSVDNTEIKLEDNQIKYAKTLVKKLKNTDLSKESFAVGITGEWGSGKSTFLNTMKEKIEKEDFAEIVEFNPWLCNSPEQVTQDFFATLINELSPKHSTLSRTINKYAKLLNKIAKPSLSIFGIDLDLTPGDDSLDELKENISNKLANLPKKVVILIDDTDRLEGNEVFEILRLIRNTADFKNVIYIATYDKEYVTDVLEGNKIKDPDNYLEKIFQVEVHLPKVEKIKLWKTFQNDIYNQFNIKEQATANTILRQLYNDAKLILQTSKNYRQIKRLARRYMVFIDYAKNNLGNEINEINLFWLEILQEQDPKIYDILANDPKKLLSEKDDLYVYKETDTNTENKIIKNIITIQILKKLFPYKPNRYIKNTINHKQNYSIYFTLKIPSYKLKNTDFNKLIGYNVNNNLNDDDRKKHVEKTITEWVESKKRIDSIVFQFNNYSLTISNENLLKNYLYGLFLISLKAVEYQKNFPIKCYIENFYDEKIKNQTKKIIINIINDTIKNINNETIVHLSKLLNNIYKTEYYDDNNVPMESYSMIISNKDIEDFLKQLVEKYFKTNNTHNATDVVDKESTLYKLLRNCCIIEKDYLKYGSDKRCLYKQLAINEVINHFKDKENKPSIEELNKTLSNNFTKITEFEDFCDEDAYIIDYENDVSDFIIRLFGGENFYIDNYYNSHFDDNEEFKTFKEKCFEQKQVNIKQVEKY